MEISFKSSNKAPLCLLSNFYGGSEFTYMYLRAKGSTLRELYLKLRDILNSYKMFNKYRDRLMDPCPPNNRPRKEQKRGRYIRKYNDEVYIAFGLIAKLISACYKDSMAKRLKEVNLIAIELGLEGDIEAGDFGDGDESFKKDAMKVALSIKFESEPYRSYLISTGDKILYESEGRGKSPWEGKEGWLGKLLMEVREELKKSILGKRNRDCRLKF